MADNHKKRTVSYATLAGVVVIVLVIGIALGQRGSQLFGITSKLSSANTLKTTSLQQTYRELSKKFDGNLDKTKLMEGASRGLVEAAGDPYTVYFDKKEAKAFKSDLDGTFSGIGAELGKLEGKLIIIAPLDDSPAARAGVKANDIIAKVNGEDTNNWSIDKAVSKIKGKAGTTVKLTLVRKDEVKQISLTRAVVNNPSLKSEIRGGVGIMRISRFGEDTPALARQAAQDFKQHNVKGVVVDVRGNGGGYLSAAQDIASLWLKTGQIVVTERADGAVTETHRASGEATLQGVPSVVLIDSGSASASEILAGALQDHDVATLLGQKSFGKGSVQQVVELRGGAELKVTVARWYTPKGNSINKTGITPDVKVKIAKGDNGRDKDAQLQRALKLLQK